MNVPQRVRKFVLLNGPPRCGKDTAGKFLYKHYNAYLYKMSAPLKDHIKQFFHYNEETMRWLEENKDEPTPLLNGRTYRQEQIDLSEEWIKPRWGKSVFGDIAVRRLSPITVYEFIVITDSGFKEEAVPLVHAFGAKNMLLVQINRPNTTFIGDSRSYIELSDLGVATTEINNVFDIDMYEQQCIRAVKRWCGVDPR